MELTNPTKTYVQSSNLMYSCQYHVVFCPKFRRAVLTDDIAEALQALLWEAQESIGYEILEMKILTDHVHLVLAVSPQPGIHTIINRIKNHTAGILRREFPALKSRLPSLWTRSHFISTVGTVTLDVIHRYLENQKGK